MTGVHDVSRKTAAAKAHARAFLLIFAACLFVQLFPVKFVLDKQGIDDPLYYKTLLTKSDATRLEKFPKPPPPVYPPSIVIAERLVKPVPEIPLRLYTIAASYWATGPPLP